MERLRLPDDPTRRAIVALVAATTVLYVVLSFVTLWTFHESRDKNRKIAALVSQNCRSINSFNRIVRTQLERSRRTLPTLDYYKHHQEELQRQLFTIEQQMSAFREQKCS